MSYNGWSNRATWNVSLWLNNDEGTYQELQALARRASDAQELATQIEDLCRAIWPDGKTPDDASLDECDFEEIATGEYSEYHEGENEPEKPKASKFATKHGIGFTCQRVPSRPDSLMNDSARHFKCRISCSANLPNRGFTVYFSQGLAHTEQPTVDDVLDCIASDAATYENVRESNQHPRTIYHAKEFESWAAELGYDTDSRKAEKIYRAVKRQAEQLKRTIGEEAYKELLWETERQ